jgi:hypothetical protein
MSLVGRWHQFALAAVFGAGVALLGAPARAEGGASATAQVATSDESCEAGQAREGSGCMHQIAPPGACASARPGSAAGGGADGGDCGDGAIGAASERFSPTDVAAGGPAGGPVAFNPRAPGPGPVPQPQPGDLTGGGPVGPPVGGGPPPPPAAPPITVRESPAPPDPLPGLK